MDQEFRSPTGLLTVKEVAAWLRIHPNTVRRWNDLGKLKAYRIGNRGDRRFLKSEVERMLEDHPDIILDQPN